MKHRWAAVALMLGGSALVPRVAAGQDSKPAPAPQAPRGMSLGQNFPNPFNPTTTIPFAIGDPPACTDGATHVVTLRIYNVLAQLVAVPILQGTASDAGRPLEKLQLPCGQYTAYWDGNYLNSTREVASGIYLYRLEVDGKAIVKKMIVMK